MSSHEHHANDTRRGSALLPALLAVMLTAVLCVSYMQLSLSKSREAQVSVDAKRAFYVAEAGLSEAYYGLARGQDGSVASEFQPARFGTGVYWVTSEDHGDRVTLQSTGLSGLGRAALSTTLRKAQASVASLGLHANQQLALGSGTLVDAYDSQAGPYLPGSGANAVVGCNGSIDLAGAKGGLKGAQIVGDSTPGPSGCVLRGPGAVVTGSTAPSTEATLLPALAVDVPADAKPLDPTPGVPLHLSAGSYAWTSLHIAKKAVVRIDGPADVVLDQLLLDDGARLELDGSAGAVRVAVASSVALANGSTLTTLSQDPQRVSLLIAAHQPDCGNGGKGGQPPVSIEASGPFYGVLYAPAAELTLPASFTVYGAAVADSITLAPGAMLHFDRALTRVLAEGSLPEFLCWRVIELPPSPLVKAGFDPLTILKLNNIVPVTPARAHVPPGLVRVAAKKALILPVTKL